MKQAEMWSFWCILKRNFHHDSQKAMDWKTCNLSKEFFGDSESFGWIDSVVDSGERSWEK